MRALFFLLLLLQMCKGSSQQTQSPDFTYNLGKGEALPKVLQSYYAELPLSKDKELMFTVSGAYWYHNQFFIPYHSEKKATNVPAPHPDQPQQPYMTIKGIKCFCSGGITGLGTGECMGMLQNGTPRSLLIKVIR